ncbi:MAG: DUF1156 domain-containing protein, partial [Firmicutes bacterium]|nr:DUF1156 domain-containing protein [Bacillota bacterium]
MYKKKLIEVALPLDAINAASVREKSIRHGHPSTLHLWWARRPLAAARAVIWASLVDDPSSNLEEFPTEEAQRVERERLFRILEELVIWENSNNEEVLNKAKAEILKSTNGNPPPLLDPFAGGGIIPLEAQRLGLETHASDLNPIAVMINKAMIEIPPKFANQPPVNPEARGKLINEGWTGAKGLAEDVRYYGDWMKQEALKRIGHLYPTVKDEDGIERTVIALIWARTVKCPNPACGLEMPLANSFVLSSKRGNEAFVQPIISNRVAKYKVQMGKAAPNGPKIGRGSKFRCIRCGEIASENYIRAEAISKRLGQHLMGIVAEGDGRRIYLSPNKVHLEAAEVDKPVNYPDEKITYNPRDFRPPYYGLVTYDELFTSRQLHTLVFLKSLVSDAREKAIQDAISIGKNQGEAFEYGIALTVYLGFLIDKLVDYHSTLCTWHYSKELIRNTFCRQAVGITWDYAEGNPFSNSSGCIDNMLRWIMRNIANFPVEAKRGLAVQRDAQNGCGLRNVMISTDPPYYDNIAYADLSDYFYVWLRRTLKDHYP